MGASKRAVKIAESQGWRCAYCAGVMELEDGPGCATCEHIRPDSRGGSASRDNLIGACRACNSVRGATMGYLDFYARRLKLLKESTWPPCTWPRGPVLAIMKDGGILNKKARRLARAACRLKDPTAYPIKLRQPRAQMDAGLSPDVPSLFFDARETDQEA